jgi:HPt (histidine-containing phosphotransfer) domain-containing protein
MGQDDDLLNSLITMFVDEIPNELTHLREALDFPKPEEVRRHLHSIKGSSSSVGAESICACARQLEEAAKASQLDRVRDGLSELERRFSEFAEVVRRT